MPAVYADPELARRLAGGWFVSFDPGVNHPAVAIWLRGVLQAATRVSVPGKFKQLDRVERCRRIAELVGDAVRAGITAGVATYQRTDDKLADLLALSGEIVGVVMEHPQWYSEKAQARSGKRPDPNRLAGMAVLDGAVAVELGAPTWSYLPGEWCGGIKKTEVGDPWDCPRGAVLRSRLRPEEIERIVATHDALDATGVGLKALGRLERNLPGTT